MNGWLAKGSEALYALMRVVVGLLFACHGAQKLFGVMGGPTQISNRELLIAGIIELVGGGLVSLGLWTSVVAFIAAGEMAAAYFTVHAHAGFWPIVNRGELAVLYCFVFLYIASRGSGPLSVDALRKTNRRR